MVPDQNKKLEPRAGPSPQLFVQILFLTLEMQPKERERAEEEEEVSKERS